jgi:hypothetical protein
MRVVLLFLLGLLSVSPLTKAEMEALAARGALIVRRIDVQPPLDAKDRARIVDTGVILWTEEPAYLIVAGDAPRVTALAKLGLALREPAEADFKLRHVRVQVSNRNEYETLRGLLSDVMPAVTFPGGVRGRAYDYQLTWARDAGFVFELCPLPCDSARP